MLRGDAPHCPCSTLLFRGIDAVRGLLQEPEQGGSTVPDDLLGISVALQFDQQGHSARFFHGADVPRGPVCSQSGKHRHCSHLSNK